MSKNISKVLSFVLVTFVASFAAAQQSPSVEMVAASSGMTTDLRIEGLPASLAQCIMQCQAAAAPVPDCVPQNKADAQKKVTALNTARAKIRSRMSVYESRLSAGQRELSDELAKQKADMKAALDKLRDQLAALDGYQTMMIERLSAVEVTVAEHEKEITTLQGEMKEVQTTVGDHEDRITALEGKQASLGLGMRFVGVGICSADETCYTGLAAGPRFALNIGDNAVVADAQAMTALKGENPFGVRMRGGYVMSLDEEFALELGVSGTFADLDAELNATAAFIGADLGVTYRPTDTFNLGFAGFGGAELDQDAPSGAMGGLLTMGVDLSL